MKLKLERPLAFFDLEATGLDTQSDRIVEIAITKLFPDGSRESKCRRLNPGINIPEKVTEIHGISNEDVADCPSFNDIAKGLLEFIEGCDIAGFNSNHFDLPMLYNHFLASGIDWNYNAFKKIDVGNIFKRKEERTLSAALKFYCGTTLENAHSAAADTEATVNIFLAQLERYPDLPQNLEELEIYTNYDSKFLDISGKFKYNENNEIVFAFGKYKGEPVSENIDFVQWMQKSNFPTDTLQICDYIIHDYYS